MTAEPDRSSGARNSQIDVFFEVPKGSDPSLPPLSETRTFDARGLTPSPMNDVVIRAEGLGKKYLIGHEAERERYTALRDVIAARRARPRAARPRHAARPPDRRGRRGRRSSGR